MGRRPRGAMPQMRRHAASNTARVRIGYEVIWLGKWGSPEAHERYRAIIRRYCDGLPLAGPAAVPCAGPPPANGVVHPGPGTASSPATVSPRLVPDGPLAGAPPDLLLVELCSRYLEHAMSYYVSADGKPTSMIDTIRMGIRALREFQNLPAAEFGPRLLEEVTKKLVEQPLQRRKNPDGSPMYRSRKTINAALKAIKLMFKWGVGVELIPPETHAKLAAAPLLKRGRSAARETPPRQPVEDAVIEATLPYLPPMIAVMVKLQRLIGCRPGELCRMRPCELKRVLGRSFTLLEWKPGQHKNDWREQEAQRIIGPRAAAILEPYLRGNPEEFCFIAAESEADRNANRRAARKSPMTPSQRERREKARRRSKPRTPITEDAYRRAITRACERHGIARWTPHQLRHAAATEARNELDIDAAQARIGTRSLNVTEVYAKRSRERAIEVAELLG